MVPVQPDPGQTDTPCRNSLLAGFLGSEDAADAWRRRERLRAREALQSAISRDLAAERREREPAPAADMVRALVRAEVQAALPGIIEAVREQVARDLAEELPEAVAAVVRKLCNTPGREVRNGEPAQASQTCRANDRERQFAP